MKKPLIVTLVILIILLIVPIISFFKWSFQPKKPLQVLILDKTVPTLERNKHRSLSWILAHNKYVKHNKRKYSYTKDYFGFVPLKPLRNKEWDRNPIRLGDVLIMADSFDVAYFADTYGVYFNDWYAGINTSNRSRLIYGGLSNSDYLFMMEMYDRQKLVIAEYNILAYPTDPLNRDKTETLLDVHWTEWTGKYFETLDTIADPTFPKWMVRLYQNQYRKTWDFTKSGIILLKNNNRIIVLEDETHLEFDTPFIYTTEHGSENFDLPYKIPFTNWFEIVETTGNDVVANFKIQTNEVGDSVLQNFFLPETFPAILQSSGPTPYFYFAGDFADNKVPIKTAYFKGIEKLKFLFIGRDPASETKFYWEYYKPMMTQILDQYYTSINPE